jgi:hypothetical protein
MAIGREKKENVLTLLLHLVFLCVDPAKFVHRHSSLFYTLCFYYLLVVLSVATVSSFRLNSLLSEPPSLLDGFYYHTRLQDQDILV